MSHDEDDYRTPLPELAAAGAAGSANHLVDHRLKSVELKFAELKVLVEKNKDALLETIGSKGDAGRLKVITDRLETIRIDVEAIQEMMENQRRFIWKMAIVLASSAMAGGGIAQAIIAAMSGG